MYKFKLKEDKYFPKIKCDKTVALGDWGVLSPTGLMIKRSLAKEKERAHF